MKMLDNLANLFGEAVTDIRQKVVEEGWFGQPATKGSAYDQLWASQPGQGEKPEPRQERDRATEIDR